jgi:predicted XRE-type DNA-binding protein
MRPEVTPASRNVFLDLGFAPGVAANLLLRSELMMEAEKLIARRKLTQTAAAKLCGVSQPRISDLHRGRIDRFSLDALVQLLARAGVKVDLVVREGRTAKA